MSASPHKTLIVACGALAKEIIAVKAALSISDEVVDLQCLPAGFHNHPEKIVPGLEGIFADCYGEYDRILVGYGDCGTGGGLDRFLKAYPKAERLPGAHCYAFYAGLLAFDEMMEEEAGSFFLTDYLAQHFQTLIIKGLGIDRHPNLKETYFKHYNRLVYLSQSPTKALIAKARSGAVFLGLAFEHRPVGYGLLQKELGTLPRQGTLHV